MAHEYSCPNPRCHCSFLYASNLQRHFRISPLCNPALGGYPAGNADSFDLSGMDLSFLTTRSDTAGEGRSEVVVNVNASSPNTCHQDTEPSLSIQNSNLVDYDFSGAAYHDSISFDLDESHEVPMDLSLLGTPHEETETETATATATETATTEVPPSTNEPDLPPSPDAPLRLQHVPTTSMSDDEASTNSYVYSRELFDDLASQFDFYHSDSEESREGVEELPATNYAVDDEAYINEVLQSLMDNEIPASYQAQVNKLHPVEEDLMILMKRNGLPIHAYKDILSWASRASSSDYDFESCPIYKTTLDRMKKKYSLEAGSPPIRGTVTVEGPFPPMHVYRFSLLHEVKRLLQHPANLAGAMWKYEETRDPVTGERVYGKLNSSDWWKNAEASVNKDLNVLGSNKPKGSHYICPIIGFDDSTLCDNIGRLMAQPFLATIGNLSDELRRSVESWFILGMIPPYPKSSKERESDRRSKLTQEQFIRFYHSCLDVILTELKELSSYKGGVPVEIPGEGIVNLHFRLCMIIGDTKGHDDMVCHFNSHSSTICRMVRDCNIPQAFGDNPGFPCEMSEQAPIEEVVDAAIHVVSAQTRGEVTAARESCRRLSQHLVRPVFWDIPTDGSAYGIFGCLPWEMLHLFNIGFMKYLLHALYNYRSIPDSMINWYSRRCNADSGNAEESGSVSPEAADNPFGKPTADFKKLPKLFDQPEFEKNFRIVQQASRRQSDRDMPRAPFRNGVTDQTRLSGQEYPGLCLITLVAMKGMLSSVDPSIEHAFNSLLFMALCLEVALTQDSYTEVQLGELQSSIQKFLRIYRSVVGPFRECLSRSGLRIPKFHGLLHMVFYIRRYGSTKNFFGGFCESHLKSLVKAPTKNTSRRQDRLDLELMNRQHESHVCVSSERTLRRNGWYDVPHGKDDSGTNNDDPSVSAEEIAEKMLKPSAFVFRAELDRTQPRARGWTIVHDGTRHVSHCLYPTVPGNHGNDWVSAILDAAESDPTGEYNLVEFYFSADIPCDVPGKHTIIRCNPDYHSYPWERRSWHDWVMVKWTTGHREYIQAARLLLMARYTDTVAGTTKDVCAINSLVGSAPKPDNLLPFFNGDKIERVVRVIPMANIFSVAYVLPTVENAGDSFPDNAEEATYFVVIPERSKWMEIGLKLIDDYDI